MDAELVSVFIMNAFTECLAKGMPQSAFESLHNPHSVQPAQHCYKLNHSDVFIENLKFLVIECIQNSLSTWHLFTSQHRDVELVSIFQVSALVGYPLLGWVQFSDAPKNWEVGCSTHINVLEVVDWFEAVSKFYSFRPSTNALLAL